MRIVDLMRYLKYLNETKDSGTELPDILFEKMKEIFLNDLVLEMSNSNSEIRSLANRVSKKFLDADQKHKSRFLNKMSSYR